MPTKAEKVAPTGVKAKAENKVNLEIVSLTEKFQEMAPEIRQHDMFNLTDNRINALRLGTGYDLKRGKKQVAVKPTDPTKAAQERSRSTKAALFMQIIKEQAVTQIAENSTEIDNISDAFYGCQQTLAGEVLRKLLIEDPMLSTNILIRLSVSGKYFADVDPRLQRNMQVLRQPIETYLDSRKSILARIKKKESVTNLIQRDERNLHKLHATLHFTMHQANTQIPGQLREEVLALFVALWDCHVAELTIRFPARAAPAALTVGLMEMLLRTASISTLKKTLKLEDRHTVPLQNENRVQKFTDQGARARCCVNAIQPDK